MCQYYSPKLSEFRRRVMDTPALREWDEYLRPPITETDVDWYAWACKADDAALIAYAQDWYNHDRKVIRMIQRVMD